MKRVLSIILTVIMIITCLPVAFAADAGYDFCLTYSDIQADKNQRDQRYGANSNSILWQQLPTDSARNINNSVVYLAKNEREGFQAYFYEATEGGRQLRIEVEPFVNADNAELKSKVYKEEYMTAIGVTLADALVPYNGEAFQTVNGQNDMFYIELRSEKNQPSGRYDSQVTLYDGDNVLTSKKVSAWVWNFELPESHYSTLVTGLYNNSSGYVNTTGFLRLCGIRFGSDGNPIAEDKQKADKIIEGWQEALLDHGVTTYELPRNLIDTDSKAAELTMADTRRKYYCVPILGTYGEGKLTQASKDKINQYKALTIGNPYLEKKAFFYPTDEPSLSRLESTMYKNITSDLSEMWPGYHAVVPCCTSNDMDQILERLSSSADILCLNQQLLANSDPALEAYTTKNAFNYKWRYPGDTSYGSFELYRWGKSPAGVLRRIFYWQDAVLDSEGMLYWNCAYYPVTNGKAFDPWENNTLPTAAGVQTGNGNGILLYPGTAKGLPAETPIISLRLKQISSGLDDYDYLTLAKESFGEDSDTYQNAINSVLLNYKKYGPRYTLRCESQKSGYGVDFVAWECVSMNNARTALGNALEKGFSGHSFGEWETAVYPDDTHNGLQIRTCHNCSTQESRKITKCEAGKHTWAERYTIDEAATCKQTGSESIHCLICDEIDPNSVREIPKTEHTFDKYVSDNNATCTADGTKTAICSICGEKNTIADAGSAKGHIEVIDPAVPATCTKTGLSQGSHCSVCGTVLVKQEVIPVKEHTQVIDPAVPATCTKTGLSQGSHCSVCGVVLVKQEVTPAKGHTEVIDPAVAATCTNTGLSQGCHCSVCGTVLVKQEVISAKGHSDGDGDHICDDCGAEVTTNCSHLCHSTNAFVSFIWKIINFFNKLFRTNQYCQCGAKHW